MGEPARKYDLFDAEPVDPDSFVAPATPRRRPARRATMPETPTRRAPEAPSRRRQPVRGEPERVRRGGAVPAEPTRRRARPDEPERRRARPQDPAPRRSPEPDRGAAAPEDQAPHAPPAPVTAPRTPFVVLVLILVSAGIVGLLVLNTEINENSYRLEQMREKQVALDTTEQRLSSQLADRQSPGNLAAAARRLGLVPADDPAFLRLPDGRVFTVPGPGSSTGR